MMEKNALWLATSLTALHQVFRDQYLPDGRKVRVNSDVSVEYALRLDWSRHYTADHMPDRVRTLDGVHSDRHDLLASGVLVETWPRDFEGLGDLPPYAVEMTRQAGRRAAEAAQQGRAGPAPSARLRPASAGVPAPFPAPAATPRPPSPSRRSRPGCPHWCATSIAPWHGARAGSYFDQGA